MQAHEKTHIDQFPKLASLRQSAVIMHERADNVRHLLVILPSGQDWHAAPEHESVLAVLNRQDKKPTELDKHAQAVELPGGCLSVWIRLAVTASTFEQHTLLRQALKILLDEAPASLDIAVYGDDEFRAQAAAAAAYVAWINTAAMPNWKSEKPPKHLQHITLHGVEDVSLAREQALAEGNALCRALTIFPPNRLTPARYRAGIRALAASAGWGIEEYDIERLQTLHAGAFLAVARGSAHDDAAIVRLNYVGNNASHTLALVGKGICFDTGGHNLKPARYMNNMHDDMNGSAVALGILTAVTRLKLPVNLTVWLAIAENHLSPVAYTQNEVVIALNGTSIEIVHTDAEGRMVLADSLALAAKEKPEAIIDFATLTGSMAVALGERMSGVLGAGQLAGAELTAMAVSAGQISGERVVAFPMPADYDEALDSTIADVKQCTLDGEADHILAARFLQRFVADTPWLHVDLSASRCKDGLGAVSSDITGFGVGLGLSLLEMQCKGLG